MTRYRCPKCSSTVTTAIKADVLCTRCGVPMLPEAIKPRQSRDKKRRSHHQPEGEQAPLHGWLDDKGKATGHDPVTGKAWHELTDNELEQRLRERGLLE